MEVLTLRASRTTRLVVFCLALVTMITGCTTFVEGQPSPAPLVTTAVPTAFAVANPDYRSLHIPGSEPVGVISYQLVSSPPNALRYWYIPVSQRVEPVTNIAEVAANQTLASVCQALGIYPVSVRGVEVKDRVAMVDLPLTFSQQVPAMTSLKAVGDALVATMTEFSDIDKVQFLVEGKVRNFLTTASAQYDTSLPLTRPKWPNEDPPRNETKVVLYWRWKDGPRIVPLTYYVPNGSDLPHQALLELLRGPQAEFAQIFAPSIPLMKGDGGKGLVRSFSVREGIAYVDFEKAALDTLILGGQEISQALEAIVLTLTEFPDITKVQFMVAGKVMAVKIGAFNLGTPFTRPRWINPS